MLCLQGLDHKSYDETLRDGWLPELACPDARCRGARLCGHGWYRRYLHQIRIAIRRLRCPCCKVTHALLPEDVCAYHDLTLPALEAALERGGGPSAQARAAGQEGRSGVRRARRWARALSSSWAQRLLGLLAATPGNLLQRVQALLGSAPGALLRLRHWLWASYLLFFAGVSGLYRHGRPGKTPAASST